MVGLATVVGSGAMTNTVDEISGAGAIFIAGSNPTSNHPIYGYRIRQAVKKGAKLIVADPRRTFLAEKADVHLKIRPGTDVAMYNGIAHVIIAENLQDTEYIEERTQGYEYLKEIVAEYTPEYVSEITGTPAEDIIKAARLFASADSGAIVYCMGVTQHTSGTENVVALTNLSLLTGNLGKDHAGMNPLRGQNNVQGACDMGCLPNVLTGYQPVHSDSDSGTYWQRLSNIQSEISLEEPVSSIEFAEPVPANKVSDAVRAKFSKAWNVELSDVPGRTIADMFHDNPSRRCKAIYIMGENPIVSDPHTEHVEEALESMEFVVLQDIFLNETAAYADVVLPAASFAEKDGSFINTERRVQLIRKAIEPRGNSKADWEIIQLLAQKLNLNWNYNSTAEIWDEVRELTPHYFGGMSMERLEKGGLQWPCTTTDHPGTPVLHKGKFARGIGQFSTVDYRPQAADPTDEEYPFILTTARKLYHYHTRTMTGKSEGLNFFSSEELMQINPQDAISLDLTSGDKVRLTSRRGTLESKFEVVDIVPQGIVCMSFHFADSAVNVLTDPAVCNMSVISGMKVSAVKLEKV